ncbi:hypothetical protein ABPG74_010945 [Tetrahymena malaccensis]
MSLYLKLLPFGLFILYIVYRLLKILSTMRTLSKRTVFNGTVDTQERWSKKKVPSKVDVVVIGSGMSGLTTAAFYSKIGKKVLVLEQHYIAGGACHSYTEQGYAFDTGFHYIGNRDDYMKIWKMTMSKDINWNICKEFDTIKFNDEKPFKFIAPKKTFIENLKNEFPDMKEPIQKYFEISRRAAACGSYKSLIFLVVPTFLQKICLFGLSILYSDVYKKSTKDVMEKLGITNNKRLTALLNGQLGDIQVTYDTVDFSDQMSLLNHYLNGSIYPQGGTMEIVSSMMGTILANGGQVLCRARVTKIITEGGQVKGVVVNDDTTIDSPLVISSIGIKYTNQLIPQKNYIPERYEDGIGHFYLFVGIKGNAKELNLPRGNMWHYPGIKDYDLNTFRQKYLNLTKEEVVNFKDFMTFTCFPTVKEHIENTPEQISCIVIAEAKNEWVKGFEITDKKRTEEYKEFKKKIEQNLLNLLYTNYPQIKGKVDFINLGTPLTNKTYYNRYSSYGMSYSKERANDPSTFLNTKTSLQGLYITGQDITCPGIAPSVLSGFVTFMKSSGVL